MDPKKVIYLTHPYSHDNPEVMRARFESANRLAGLLMMAGYVVFSPLSHSVPIADTIENHRSYDFWLGQDLPILRRCDEVWVPLVDGFEESNGIKAELAEARRLFKPVVYFTFNDSGIEVMARVQVVESMMGFEFENGEFARGSEDGQV